MQLAFNPRDLCGMQELSKGVKRAAEEPSTTIRTKEQLPGSYLSLNASLGAACNAPYSVTQLPQTFVENP